ncbi:unnamed protein product [Trifolium pratense]|uniref:Uncharacterized protein n=1 Tax=Trifolium pratense TaxID=57577 RepID=A0ACB0IN80_TRIPR|nr:unnamed protein product [Trifolium pratense]
MISRYLLKAIPSFVWTSQAQRMVYVIDSANPMDGLQRLCERSSGVQYFVEHHSSLFYILTNAPLPDSKCSGGEYYLVRC